MKKCKERGSSVCPNLGLARPEVMLVMQVQLGKGANAGKLGKGVNAGKAG